MGAARRVLEVIEQGDRHRASQAGPARSGCLARVDANYLTRTSFMIRPETFQSSTYRLPSPSQDEPCVPLKIPSIHSDCGTL